MSEDNAPARGLDEQNPWPGLAPYDEASTRFFHGREDEADELLRLIRLAPLTILYGASGLGKSSLLLAGVFPRLRAERFLPVHMRLDFSESAKHPPLEQAARRLEEELALAGVEFPSRASDEDLWRYLHRTDFEVWSRDNFPIVPVLVFDQFEELFSHGGRHEHIRAIVDSLADLLENRIPADLSSDETSPELRRRLDLRTQRYRVLLSFREDFLPEIDGWKDKVPSLLEHRLRLLPMSREKAIEAVERAGREVLEAGIAQKIVDLVSSRARESEDGQPESERPPPTVEPVLLSLCCTRLNRLRNPDGRIDAALVDRAGEDILAAFYREAIEGMPERVQKFIEDELIQGGRYRGSYAEAAAIEDKLITQEELQRLTDDYRLLRIDQQADTRRIELIHDRLVEVVRKARDERKAKASEEEAQRLQREAEEEARIERERREQAEEAKRLAEEERARARRLSRLLSVVCVLLVGIGSFAWYAKYQADKARHETDTARRATIERRLVGEAQAMLDGARTVRPDRVLLQLMAARNLGVSTNAVVGPMLKELLQRPQLLQLIPTEQTVSGLAFVDDLGLLVATDGDSGRLLVFDAATGQPSGPRNGRTEPGHAGWIWALAYSPVTHRLASAGEDGTVRLWDVGYDGTIRAREARMARHVGAVKALAFSPSGESIVSGGDDRTLRVWNAEDGRYLGALLGEHNAPVTAIAFHPDGGHLVSASEDSTLRVWDIKSRRQIGQPLAGHKGAVRSVAFRPDGNLLVSAGEDRTIVLRRPKAARGADRPDYPIAKVLSEHSGGICCVAFLADRVGLASGAWDGELRAWDTRAVDARESKAEARGGPFEAYSRGLQSIAVARDGRVASGSDGGGIALWDLAATASRALGRPGDSASGVQASMTGAAPSASPAAPFVSSVAVSRSGNRIAAGRADRIVRVWDIDPTGDPRWLADLKAPVKSWGVALSDDGNRLAAGGDDGIVRLWDIPGRRLIASSERLHGSMVWSVAFDPQGQRLASASQDGTVRLWRIGAPNGSISGSISGIRGSTSSSTNGTSRGAIEAIDPPLTGHAGGVNAVAFDQAGKRIVSGGDDGTVRVWSVADRQQIPLRPMAHDGPVLAVAFSPDGETIASGGTRAAVESRAPNGQAASQKTETVRLWASRTGEPDSRGGFGRRMDKVTSLAFSGNDRIVAGGADGALRQWNIDGSGPTDRRFDALFTGHQGRVNGVAMTPDRRGIVSAGADGTVRLWPGPEAWPKRICAKLTHNLSHQEWRKFVSDKDRYEPQCPDLPVPPDGATEAEQAETE